MRDRGQATPGVTADVDERTATGPVRLGLLWGTAAVAVLALVTYLYGRFGFTNAGDLADPRMANHDDFDSFRSSAAELWSGGDPYSGHNLNPPAWMPLFSLFVPLNALQAYRLFTLASIAFLLAAMTWTADVTSAPRRVALLGVTALMLSGPMQYTLWQGQIYTLLALGLTAAWVLDRSGRTLASSVVLGVLAALKPSLVVMMLWPVVHRHWRDLGWGAIALLSTATVGLLFGGPSVSLAWARLILSYSQDGNDGNASLASHAYRLFTPNGFTSYVAAIPWLASAGFLVGAIIVVITLLAARRTELGYWALVAASLLASPVAWRGYLVLLAPAVVVLLAARGTRPAGLFLVSLQLVPGTWPDLWADHGTVGATVALTLPCVILVTHWAVLLAHSRAMEDTLLVPLPSATTESSSGPDVPERSG